MTINLIFYQSLKHIQFFFKVPFPVFGILFMYNKYNNGYNTNLCDNLHLSHYLSVCMILLANQFFFFIVCCTTYFFSECW